VHLHQRTLVKALVGRSVRCSKADHYHVGPMLATWNCSEIQDTVAKSSHGRGCRHICLPHRYRTSRAIPGYPAPRMIHVQAPSPFGVHALRYGKANACGHNLTMHLSPESYLTPVPIQGSTKLTQLVKRKFCSASRRGRTI